MKKLIQSAFCGMALLSTQAFSHPDHGAPMLHMHPAEWAALIAVIVALVGGAVWFRNKK